MDTGRAPVTVVGLGQMGSALATTLVETGHPVTAWNRSAGRARAVADRGVRVAETPREAITASRLVVVCLRDYAAVHAVLDPVVDALAGRTLVNLTSGSPEQARETATWAATHGVDYLDGAIMTTPPGVGSPEVMFLFAGAEAAFTTHRPTLAALGDPLHLGTDPGLASLYDVALLGLMWSTMTGWLHGTALVGAERTPATAFTPVALRWLATVGTFLTRYAGQVDAGRYPGDDATVDIQIAAIEHLIHAAADRGVDNALPELLRDMMRKAEAGGHGADSYASLITVLRPSAGAR
ncbi:3-hydroxyisobutyrate dehydrogenase [Micromonospora citrea]|uniref:3-hydroxyisobutyrate dehydrogenase n=1 Tax=Micromonospora citrea TaxID=47855 RepID=A0A1C6W179_9ACTN|nr:NAD(P)-binding domain-containing protein [Micromonospora citrea]SCL72174.1 3-hydroxyisobutyrate dehydrogenase [Micromonospora citrea]